MKNKFLKATLPALLLLCMAGCNVANSQKEKELTSPFVGRWAWVENTEDDYFYMMIGSRNDSLLLHIWGFFYGCKFQDGEIDRDKRFVPQMWIPLPIEGNIAHGKISGVEVDFYRSIGKEFFDVTLELVNDDMMIWNLEECNCYWPETAVMERYDEENQVDFSMNPNGRCFEDLYDYKRDEK